MKTTLLDLSNPRSIAFALRHVFERAIPKTWAEFHSQAFHVTPFGMAQMLQEQIGGEFGQAAALVVEVCPELFAEYWEGR